MLDVYELCTPELQEKMVSFRSKFKDIEDKKVNQQPSTVGFYCCFPVLKFESFDQYLAVTLY